MKKKNENDHLLRTPRVFTISCRSAYIIIRFYEINKIISITSTAFFKRGESEERVFLLSSAAGPVALKRFEFTNVQ